MKLNSRIYNIERTNAMRNAMRGRMSVDDALEYFFENDTKMLEKLIDVYNYNMKMYHTCGEDSDNILTVDKLRDIRIAAKFKIDEGFNKYIDMIDLSMQDFAICYFLV